MPVASWLTKFTASAALLICTPMAADARQHVDDDGDPIPAGALLRIGTTRFRPGGNVTALAFRAGGKELVSVNNTTGIQVWDPDGGRLLRQYGRPDRASTGAVSADGSVAVVMEYKQFVIRETATGKTTATITPPEGSGYSTALSLDGSLLADVGFDNSMRVWDVPLGSVRTKRKADNGRSIENMAFAADNRGLALMPYQGAVEVWDVATGAMRWKTAPEVAKVGYAGGSFSPDGKTLAVRTGLSDNVHFYDVETGKLLRMLPKSTNQYYDSTNTPDGKFLVTTDLYSEIGVWDVATGLSVKRFSIRASALCHLTVSPDGQWVAGVETYDATRLRVWNLSNGSERRLDTAARGPYVDARFLRDGQTLAAMSAGCRHLGDLHAQGCYQLTDAATGKKLKDIPWPGKEDAFASLSADGKVMAVAEERGNLRLCDVATGKTKVNFAIPPDGQIRSVALTQDGGLVVVDVAVFVGPGFVGGFRYSTLVFDAVTGESLHNWPIHDGGRPRLVDQTLAHIAYGHKGNTTLTIKDIRSGARLNHTVIERPWIGGWRDVDLSPCGRFVANRADWRDDSFVLYETATGKQLHDLPRDGTSASACVFSPNGRLAVEGTWHGDLCVWDVGSGKKLATVPGHRGTITALDFSGDGSRLVSAGADTTLLVWDAAPWHKAAARAALKALPSDPWSALASLDPEQAGTAIAALTASPEIALKLLRQHLQPASAEDIRAIEGQLRLLDDPRYGVRQQATNNLKNQGVRAAAALQKKLNDNPTLETRRRVEALLQALPDVPWPADVVRQRRALAVLEWIATPEAIDLLTDYSRGHPEACLTHEATTALRRIKK
jgi:WD40 repeat protein